MRRVEEGFLSNLQDELRPNSLTLQALIAPVVAILVICVGVIISILVSGTRLQDLGEIARSQQIAKGAFDVVGRDLGRLAIGLARSQQAFEKLVLTLDTTWAERRFSNISNPFGRARPLLLDGSDRIVYSLAGDRELALPDDARGLVQTARRLSPTPPDMRAGFVNIDGHAYVAAASIVAPPELAGTVPGGDAPHVLLLIQPINESMLGRLGQDFLLSGLHFVAADEVSKPSSIFLETTSGQTVGAISWDPAQPGQELRTYILLPIVLATLVAGLLLTSFIKTAGETAREIRRGAMALAESGEALEHSENKLQAILDGVADGIVGFDESGLILSVNAAAARIFDRDPESMLGEPAESLLADTNSDAAESLRADRRTGETEYRDFVGVRRDGSRFLLDAAISHITYQSRAIAIAIMRDVTESRQAEETLNLLSTGMMLVGSNCRLLQANRSAARILDSKDGMALANGRVTVASRAEAEHLQALVERICSGDGDGDEPNWAVMTIDRGRDVRPLSIMVAPLQLNRSGENTSVAAIFIRDLEVRQSVPPEVLAKLFGLTPAEARVVVELVKGRRPQEVAEELGVSLNTVRNQLKQIFSKTNTGRQSELISLVLSSAAFVSEQGFDLDDAEPAMRLSGT